MKAPRPVSRTLPRPVDRVTNRTEQFSDELQRHRTRQQWHGVYHFTEPTTNPRFITKP